MQSKLRCLARPPRLLAGRGDLDSELAVPGQARDANSRPDWRIGGKDVADDLAHFGEIVAVGAIDDASYDVGEPSPMLARSFFTLAEPDRLPWAYRAASFLAAGVTLAASSDRPVARLTPPQVAA